VRPALDQPLQSRQSVLAGLLSVRSLAPATSPETGLTSLKKEHAAYPALTAF
jgi:hypothetical protein